MGSSLESPVCVGSLEWHLCIGACSRSFNTWQCHISIKVFRMSGLMKRRQVSFYRIFHLFTSRTLNTPLLLFLDLRMRYLDQMIHVPNCVGRQPLFGHFDHIQPQAHVGLFRMYLTSVHWHSGRHVDNLQQTSCCWTHWDLSTTTTIGVSIASSNVIMSCLIHFRWCSSGNSSVNMPEPTTSWC